MDIRKELAQRITGQVPANWTVYAHGKLPTNPRHPVIVVRQRNVRRTQGAPRLYRDTDFSIAMVEPAIDAEKVEDALDTDLETLLDAIDAVDMPGLVWSEAERVTFEDTFHGYDITATVTNKKETP